MGVLHTQSISEVERIDNKEVMCPVAEDIAFHLYLPFEEDSGEILAPCPCFPVARRTPKTMEGSSGDRPGVGVEGNIPVPGIEAEMDSREL